MKKPLAILLLILGGMVMITLIAFITGVIFLIMAGMIPASGGWVLYTAAAMFLFLVSYPFKFLRDYFKKDHGVNAPVFTVCFCAPSLIAAGAANLFYSPAADDSEVVSVEALLMFWLIITAVFTVWMIVHACVAAYKHHIDKNA